MKRVLVLNFTHRENTLVGHFRFVFYGATIQICTAIRVKIYCLSELWPKRANCSSVVQERKSEIAGFF